MKNPRYLKICLATGLLAVLSTCMEAKADLTQKQIAQLISFAGNSGFSYDGTWNLEQISKGKPCFTTLLLFSRAMDNGRACVPMNAQTYGEAVDEFLGSKLMFELLTDLNAHNQPKASPTPEPQSTPTQTAPRKYDL